MSEVGTRVHWRDTLAVAALAVVLVGGLVHFAQGMGDDRRPAARDSHGGSTQAGPSGEATAQLEGAPASDPTSPAAPTGRTCWDGRETTGLRLCGLPEGARGLSWVFPSFGRDRDQCHRAQPRADSYPVVESYECFQRARGQAVTVTYDRVGDPARVEQWLEAHVGAAHRLEIPGPQGGRSIFKDSAARPVRITGTYERFPYVVSVYADSPRTATLAWTQLVLQRPEEQIRGVRG
jgi:hypothetical protein